jgi:hypothetical protein
MMGRLGDEEVGVSSEMITPNLLNHMESNSPTCGGKVESFKRKHVWEEAKLRDTR